MSKDRVRVLRALSHEGKDCKVGQVIDWADSPVRRQFVAEGFVEEVIAKAASDKKGSDKFGGGGDDAGD